MPVIQSVLSAIRHTICLVSTSQTLTVKSLLPDAKSEPSGLKVSFLIVELCPPKGGEISFTEAAFSAEIGGRGVADIVAVGVSDGVAVNAVAVCVRRKFSTTDRVNVSDDSTIGVSV